MLAASLLQPSGHRDGAEIKFAMARIPSPARETRARSPEFRCGRTDSVISATAGVKDQSTKSPRTRLKTSSNLSAVTFETRALPTLSSLLPSQLYLLCHSSHSLHSN